VREGVAAAVRGAAACLLALSVIYDENGAEVFVESDLVLDADADANAGADAAGDDADNGSAATVRRCRLALSHPH
jgi:hypothetical protein